MFFTCQELAEHPKLFKRPIRYPRIQKQQGKEDAMELDAMDIEKQKHHFAV